MYVGVWGSVASIAVSAFVSWLVVPRATIVRIGSIPEQLMGGDLNQRINIWVAGWQAFVHAPLVGSGAGSFVAASVLGISDMAGKYYFPAIGSFLIYLVMLSLLMWRPAGIFGRRT